MRLVSCETCGVSISKQPYQIARSSSGKFYCSKHKKDRRTGVMTKCLYCNISVYRTKLELVRSPNVYCGRSHAAKANNHLSPKRERKVPKLVPRAQRPWMCQRCGSSEKPEIPLRPVICVECRAKTIRKRELPCVECGLPSFSGLHGGKCRSDVYWRIKVRMIEDGTAYDGNRIQLSERDMRRYLIESRGYRCQECSLVEWMGRPIPLVADHISGDPYDDRLSNLRIVCTNCDGIGDTWGARNRGRGRVLGYHYGTPKRDGVRIRNLLKGMVENTKSAGSYPIG